MLPSVLNSTPVRSSFRLVRLAAASAVLFAACSSDNTMTTGRASAITVVSGGGQSGTVGGSVSAPLIVKVTDASGNPVSGVAVTFTATNGATLGTSTVNTNASGTAQTTLTLGHTAGAITVTASVSGVSTPATFQATGQAGTASAIVMVSGAAQTGVHGTALANPLIVQVNDQYGNPVQGATVVFTATNGTVGASTATTDATGKAQTVFTLPATAGASVITATLNGTTSTATFAETGT